jgi:hypothetical protein
LTSFEIFGTLLEPIWRVSKRHCIMRFVWSWEIMKCHIDEWVLNIDYWISVKFEDWSSTQIWSSMWSGQILQNIGNKKSIIDFSLLLLTDSCCNCEASDLSLHYTSFLSGRLDCFMRPDSICWIHWTYRVLLRQVFITFFWISCRSFRVGIAFIVAFPVAFSGSWILQFASICSVRNLLQSSLFLNVFQ